MASFKGIAEAIGNTEEYVLKGHINNYGLFYNYDLGLYQVIDLLDRKVMAQDSCEDDGWSSLAFVEMSEPLLVVSHDGMLWHNDKPITNIGEFMGIALESYRYVKVVR